MDGWMVEYLYAGKSTCVWRQWIVDWDLRLIDSCERASVVVFQSCGQ